jgi:integrin alpha FG-GAP repeat containing protein 1
MHALSQHETLDFIHSISVPTSTLAHPIPIDADGDLKIDLLGITPASSSDSESPLQLWKNVWNVSYPQSPIFNMCVLPKASYFAAPIQITISVDPIFKGKQCTLANPHSNAVVDLNGDCLAGLNIFSYLVPKLDVISDIFLMCDNGRQGKSYQIWVNNKEEGFSLSQEGPLPPGVQSIAFADVGMSNLSSLGLPDLTLGRS